MGIATKISIDQAKKRIYWLGLGLGLMLSDIAPNETTRQE